MEISRISGTGYFSSSSAASQTIWSSQQLAELQSYVQQHMSVNEIAIKLNRPVSAVKAEAAALGLNLDSE